MPRTFYSVAFRDIHGASQLSRLFNTSKAARKWATWLLTLPDIKEVSVYRGQPGGELIERKAA